MSQPLSLSPLSPLSSTTKAPPVPAPAPEEVDISVLVPVLNEAESVQELSRRVAEVLDGLGRTFEIIFVDDGSRTAPPPGCGRRGSAIPGSSSSACAATSARPRR